MTDAFILNDFMGDAQALFPFPVAVSGRLISSVGVNTQLNASELSGEPSMSPARNAEFIAGRLCAQDALSSVGCTQNSALYSHSLGFPVWPSGYVGSITHKNDFVIAAVTNISHSPSIGIDLEVSQAADLRLTKKISVERELSSGPDMKLADKTALIFSIKEAYFKYSSPIALSRELDFKDLEIVWSVNEKAFEIILISSVPNFAQVPPARGFYIIKNGLMLTASFSK